MEDYFPNLVTGGCGFVGSHMTRKLLNQGEEVHIVDNLLAGEKPENWLKNGFKKLGNENDYSVYKTEEGGKLFFYEKDVREFFKENPHLDVGDVFHFAAVIGGRTTIEGEPLKVASDLSIDAEFFNWAIDSEPERILYASSSAAYPTRLQKGENTRKLREDDIKFEDEIGGPDMTYGWSKLTGEYQARIAGRDYGLSVACVRPFSGYGGEQDFSYPVPAIARRVVNKKNPLTIWGSGKQVRDFIHIKDCIEGMEKAINKISDGSAVNLGTGKPTDFIELAELMSDIKGYDPEVKNLPDKPEGVKYRCADISKMKNTLDWKPSISIREGMSEVIETVDRRLE